MSNNCFYEGDYVVVKDFSLMEENEINFMNLDYMKKYCGRKAVIEQKVGQWYSGNNVYTLRFVDVVLEQTQLREVGLCKDGKWNWLSSQLYAADEGPEEEGAFVSIKKIRGTMEVSI